MQQMNEMTKHEWINKNKVFVSVRPSVYSPKNVCALPPWRKTPWEDVFLQFSNFLRSLCETHVIDFCCASAPHVGKTHRRLHFHLAAGCPSFSEGCTIFFSNHDLAFPPPWLVQLLPGWGCDFVMRCFARPPLVQNPGGLIL